MATSLPYLYLMLLTISWLWNSMNGSLSLVRNEIVCGTSLSLKIVVHCEMENSLK